MFFVDSHCHLNFPDYNGKEKEIIDKAEQVGVNRFLTACTRLSEVPELISLTEKCPEVFASVGVHPEYATEQGGEMPSVQYLCRLTSHPKIVAIGEAGLDYHYGSQESRQNQIDLFRLHLKAAKASKLPIIIHSREAEDDTIALLEEEASPDLSGVLHCFSSQRKLAEKGLELGFYISASGIITFKSANDLRDIFKSVPMDRLLIETDAPYLAPVPYRGQKNEPSYIIKTAEMLAVLKNVDLETICRQTTLNFFTLFSKAQ